MVWLMLGGRGLAMLGGRGLANVRWAWSGYVRWVWSGYVSWGGRGGGRFQTCAVELRRVVVVMS